MPNSKDAGFVEPDLVQIDDTNSGLRVPDVSFGTLIGSIFSPTHYFSHTSSESSPYHSICSTLREMDTHNKPYQTEMQVKNGREVDYLHFSSTKPTAILSNELIHLRDLSWSICRSQWRNVFLGLKWSVLKYPTEGKKSKEENEW